MALAHEMVRELYRDVWGSNVLLKLDMAKAYDRLEWPFFLKVLRKLVFPLSGLVSSSSLGILYSESCVMNLIIPGFTHLINKLRKEDDSASPRRDIRRKLIKNMMKLLH